MGERIGILNYKFREGHHPATKWTLDRMTEALKTIKDAGELIDPTFLLNHGRLRNAIYRYPGSWRRVVSAAGYDSYRELASGREFRRKQVNADQH